SRLATFVPYTTLFRSVPLKLPGASPMLLETVAVTGGWPNARSTGKVKSVPEPATALIPPAANPARRMATASQIPIRPRFAHTSRSEEHTSELQSRFDL